MVLSGIDRMQGGTWLGLSNRGHFSCLTNFRGIERQSALSRGELVSNYFKHAEAAPENASFENVMDSYIDHVIENGDEYSGFTLLVGHLGNPESTSGSFKCWSNSWRKACEQQSVPEGADVVFGFANTNIYDTEPDHKVKNGIPLFEQYLANHSLDCAEKLSTGIFENVLQAPGVIQERVLRGDRDFQTVSSTVILKDRSGKVHFFETAYCSSDNELKHFNFQL
jgi:uncharacterized protein with NRDE domain